MEPLRQHEVFELEVLENLSRTGFLRSLVFGGGTMLRLCHDLPRYSADLDFWFSRKMRTDVFYEKLSAFLRREYRLTDVQNKYYTLLYEFGGKTSPRKLKIEIRKEIVTKGLEDKIAFSKYAPKQVLVRTLSLEEMAKRKIRALKDRTEVRDYFDLEFLLRRGVLIHLTEEDKSFIKKRIAAFKKSDYTDILGGLLEKDLREYYAKNGFSYLLERLS